MANTCKRCQQPLPRSLRVAGACPHCGAAFDTAELIALCIGLTCSFVLALVSPELVTALLHPGSWHAPSDTVVLVRVMVLTTVLVGGLVFLSAKYALWQGAALSAHRWLRLLWVVAFPGLLYVGLVLAVGVTVVALRQRRPLQHSLAVFLEER